MLKPKLNNSWVIYEIPGHKVGMCGADKFPHRPNRQVNALMGRKKYSLKKDGDVKVLQRLEDLTRHEAFEVETEWQDKLGYLADVDKVWLTTQQKERNEKLSATLTGKPCSEETKAKIGAANRGKVRTAEHRANMSASRVGRVVSDETRAKLSVASTGRLHSEESKKKMSDAQKGKPVSDETRAKLSAAAKGRFPSEETKAKNSASQKGRVVSDETKAKMSAAQKERQRRKREGDSDGNK